MTAALNEFQGLVVAITGASRGLGRATARAFLEAGASVAICARQPAALQAVADDLGAGHGARLLAVAADITRAEDVRRFVEQTTTRFGRLDVLINNAGCGLIARVDQASLADAQALFATNFFGTLDCVQQVLPVMERQGRGHVIFVSSIAGLRGIPNSAIYSASKAAVVALADALRIECRRAGIRVTTVCPGRLEDTTFFEHAKTYGPLRLYAAPETLPAARVVDALLEAVRRPRPLIVLPFQSRLVHWLQRWAPRLLDRQLYKRMPDLRAEAAAAAPAQP